jgi:hypothetical protein
MKIFILLVFVTINTLTISGCATVNNTFGKDFNSQNVQKIIEGKTTTKELVELFGEPFSKSAMSATDEYWLYTFMETTAKVQVYSATQATFNQKQKELKVNISNDVVEYFTFTENENPNAGSTGVGLLPARAPEEVQPKAEISVAQSEDTEAVGSSAQGNPESTQASSLSLEISEANEQENHSTQKSLTTQSNATNVKSLYSANNDDEIYQYLGRSSSDIKEQLELRYHNDCTLRSGEFSFCDTTFLYRSKQSESSVETRQAGGVTVQRIHGFQGENYAGLKVHISGASKFLLAAIDQQVRQVKTQRLDLQVLLETPKPGEVILWFGHDLKTLDDILFDHAKPAES